MMIVDVPLFLGATMSVCSFYLMSQREVFGERWKRRITYLPAVLAVGIGLSVNNAQGRAGGAVRHAVRVHAHAQVPGRGRGRRVEAEALPRQVQLGALRRAAARRLLHRSPRSTRSPTGSSARCPSSCSSSAGFLYAAGLSLFAERRQAGLVPRAGGLRTSSPPRPSARPTRSELQGRGVRRVLCITLGLNVAVSRGQDRRRQALGQPGDGGRRLPQPGRRREQRRRPGRRGVRLRAARPAATPTATASSRPRPPPSSASRSWRSPSSSSRRRSDAARAPSGRPRSRSSTGP